MTNGLAELERLMTKNTKPAQDNAPKATWFTLKDGQSAKVIFLQELDEASDNYSEKNGLIKISVEHSNPANYRAKAACSLDDEGRCYGEEQHSAKNNPNSPDYDENYKGQWKGKVRIYANVLVDDSINKPYVAILSQSIGPKQITPALVEQAKEIGTITDKWFKIKRTGSGLSDTSYLLTALGQHDVNVEDYELFDLERAIRKVPYAEQEKHYNWKQDAQDPWAQAKQDVANPKKDDVW